MGPPTLSSSFLSFHDLWLVSNCFFFNLCSDITNTSAMASMSISQPSQPPPHQRNPSPRRSAACPPPTSHSSTQSSQYPPSFPSPTQPPFNPSQILPQSQPQQSKPHEEPLAAPQPTRVSAIPPLQQENFPSLRPTTHTAAPAPTAANTGPAAGGIWSPDMGIKFGSPAAPSGAVNASNSNESSRGAAARTSAPAPAAPVPGKWDPSRGLRFS